MSALWEELQNYHPFISCTCSAAAQFAKVTNEEKIHQFVMGLDDSRLGSLCTTIISTDPLPDLEKFIQSSSTSRRDDSILKNKNMLCSLCGRSGHEKKGCWQIVGYPDWWIKKNKKGKGKGNRPNNKEQSVGQDNALAAHATSSNASNFPQFTAEQWTVS